MREHTPVVAPEHSDMAQSFVFYFTFREGDRGLTYGFIVSNRAPLFTGLNALDFNEFTELMYDAVVDDLESEFGVHDWSTSPNLDIDAIGFTSYEVEPDQVLVLLERWRTWFVSKGAIASRVVSVTDSVATQGDDLAIYRDIEAKL